MEAAKCHGGLRAGHLTGAPRLVTLVALLFARCAKGEVWCWGRNDFGQVTPPLTLGDVVMMDMGYQHACALQTEDGSVHCWGSNAYGQTSVPGGLTSIHGVVAGGYHTCVWDGLGGVQCWGRNNHGQTDVPADLGTVLGVTVGMHNACAWNTAGEVHCWGEDPHGVVSGVPAGLDVIGVALGIGEHACAWDSAGIAYCWGKNDDGQATPNQPTKNGYIDLAVGASHTCGLRANGKVRCWGASELQQQNVPGFFSNGVNIAAGETGNCGGRTGVMCWGLSDYGETTVPVELVSGPTVHMTMFSQSTCAWSRATTTTTTTTSTWSTSTMSTATTSTQSTSTATTFTNTTLSTTSQTNTTTATTQTTLMTATATTTSRTVSTTTSTTVSTTATTLTTSTRSITSTTSSTYTVSTTSTSSSTTSSSTSSTSSTSSSSTITGTTLTFTTTTSTSTSTTSATITSVSSTVTTTSTFTTATRTFTTTFTPIHDNSFFGSVSVDVRNVTRQLVTQARTHGGRWVQHHTAGTSEAVTIGAENLTTNGAYVNVGNVVLVPVELLRTFVGGGEEIVLVVTEVDQPQYFTDKAIDQDLGEIFGIVDVSLYNRATGQVIQVDDKLQRHILIKLSDQEEPPSDTAGACVHGKGNRWSTEGMRRPVQEELDRASQTALERPWMMDVDDLSLVDANTLSTSGVWCSSMNLGVNAFQLGPGLTCAGASVVMAEDLPDDDDDNPWITSRPALLYFALLLFLASCHIYALHADKKYSMMDTWSDRRLDTLITQLTPEVHSYSNTLQQGSRDGVTPFYPYVTMALLVRCRLVTERHAVSLKGFPSEVLRSSFGPWGYNRRVWIFFRAFHPLLTLGDPPFLLSCVKNAKLMTDTILFSLCVLCLVFSATGEMLAAGSDAGCVPRSFAVGWVLFLIGLSAFACGLPCRLPACCFARHDPEQRPSWRADWCFWLCGLLWTTLHLVVTLLFLSNVAPVDRWKWEVLYVLVLLFVFLVKPLLIALILALWCGIVVRMWPELLQDPTPLPQGNAPSATVNEVLAGLDEVQRATIKNIARRGISVAHLLDFYQKLGTVVMPQFDPGLATTEDVVRQAIIPLSRGDAAEMYGTPLKVKIGILRLLQHPGRVCDVFVRCEVLSRPTAVLDTWAVTTVGLRQMDWCMEAELLGYHPGDSLELSLIEADTGRKVCSGHLRSRVLAGQQEVPLLCSTSNACLGTITLQIEPPVSARAPTVLRSTPEPLVVQSQGYLEWCGVADAVDHPAVPELAWITSHCRGSNNDNRPRNSLHFGDVEISIQQAQMGFHEEEMSLPPRTLNVMGTSYAGAVNLPILPGNMVTHTWSNCFAHLMATVLADALGQETYGQLLPMLAARDTAKLRSLLGAAGKLEKSYWIDAFSINQHMSICSTTPQLVDSMGARISACTCATPKIAAGPVCENDKMQTMMAYLAAECAERGAEFEHVVSVDPGHGIFARTWCLVELHTAYEANMSQTFMLHSFDDLDAQATRAVVDGIDIRTSKTSFEEDKKHLLSKIDDPEAFNERVRILIGDRLRNTNAVREEKMGVVTVLLDTLLA